MAIMNASSDNDSGDTMQNARIVDETGRLSPWIDTIREVLRAAGYDIADTGDEMAGLTVLLYPENSGNTEKKYNEDVLLIAVPDYDSLPGDKSSRTEIIGTHRLIVRHHLTDADLPNSLAKEIRPLINLFLT